MNLADSNALNARLSTNPRTEEGKAVVSRNALKHGGYSTQSEATPYLGEDPAKFKDLHAGFVQSLNPSGILEQELVGKMASAW